MTQFSEIPTHSFSLSENCCREREFLSTQFQYDQVEMREQLARDHYAWVVLDNSNSMGSNLSQCHDNLRGVDYPVEFNRMLH